MRRAMHQTLKLTLAGVSLLAASWACAQDVELLVKHTTVSSGADGVQRSTEYAERISRSNDHIWVSRMVPTKAHSDHDHAKDGKAHKHLDVSTASRWISKDALGNAQISLVPSGQKVLVNISKSDWENVGFDGSWDAAWGLIDPARLKRMKTATVAGDLTTYILAEKGRSMKVVWNTKLRVPVLVESSDASSRRQTAVQVLQVALSRPWEQSRNFEKRDYSDYLD
jgi:hypothetical protein